MIQRCAKYSLVIFPLPIQSEAIQSLKLKLREKIGWYSSCNAAAHVTVIEFWDETELNLYLPKIRQFCKTVTPQSVTFNSFNNFGAHTFYLEPTPPSEKYLNKLIKNLHAFLNLKTSAKAHMSIGRKLGAENIKAAYSLFRHSEVNFEFNCDSFHLREFNNQTQQYSTIIEKIYFEGKSLPNLFDL